MQPRYLLGVVFCSLTLFGCGGASSSSALPPQAGSVRVRFAEGAPLLETLIDGVPTDIGLAYLQVDGRTVATSFPYGTITPFTGVSAGKLSLRALDEAGYAVGPLIIQRHLQGLDSIGPIASSLAVASLVLLLPAALTLPQRWPSAVALCSVAVLGVLCTAIAMLLMFYLVREAGAARASIITYINPAVATLLGVGLLHEQLGPGGITAFVVILVGSFLATRQTRLPRGDPAQAPA